MSADPAGRSSRRDQLLDLASDLFARNGLRNTTVRDIADAAGILSGSLYHHFDSKESMVDEIIRRFLGRLFTRYRDIIAADLPSAETVRELVIASFEAIDRDHAAVAIYQTEAKYLAAHQERFTYIHDFNAEFRQIWGDVLTRGVDDGTFRSDLNLELMYRFLRDTVWVAVRWYRPGGSLTVGEVADQYLHIVLDGMVAR